MTGAVGWLAYAAVGQSDNNLTLTFQEWYFPEGFLDAEMKGRKKNWWETDQALANEYRFFHGQEIEQGL